MGRTLITLGGKSGVTSAVAPRDLEYFQISVGGPNTDIIRDQAQQVTGSI